MSRRTNTRASIACAAAVGVLWALPAALPWGAGRAAAVAPSTASSAPSEDIRDIRGPKGLTPFWLVPALLAGAALLAMSGYTAWRWRRRQPAPRALLPFETALRRLEDIRRLLDPSSVREFSIAISDIVRRYIEEAFKVTATHRTTEEFLHDLLESANASLAVHRNLLADFLQQCDMAKFAGVGLSNQIMESLHRSARSFVIETSKGLSSAETNPARGSRMQEAHDSLPSA